VIVQTEPADHGEIKSKASFGLFGTIVARWNPSFFTYVF